MINIFVICKNPAFIKQLEPLLNENEIAISGICTEPSKAAAQIVECVPQPGIALVDVNWMQHETNFTEILASVLNCSVSLKIILTTADFNARVYYGLQNLNIYGYFCRNLKDFNDIVKCIKQIDQGKTYFLEASQALAER